MSFLGSIAVVAKVTHHCDWRIRDLVEGDQPVSLYLVVPPSGISCTKPLVRLIINQIGRRLTEDLHASRSTTPSRQPTLQFPRGHPARR